MDFVKWSGVSGQRPAAVGGRLEATATGGGCRPLSVASGEKHRAWSQEQKAKSAAHGVKTQTAPQCVCAEGSALTWLAGLAVVLIVVLVASRDLIAGVKDYPKNPLAPEVGYQVLD